MTWREVRDVATQLRAVLRVTLPWLAPSSHRVTVLPLRVIAQWCRAPTVSAVLPVMMSDPAELS